MEAYPGFARTSVQVGGCEVQFLEAGQGRTVVFLHGGGGFRFDAEVFRALSDRYHLLVPSAPGFDESTPGSTETIEDAADVMAAFIQAVAPDGRALVIGESFGGFLASWVAVRHPEVVEALVLAAPAGLRQADGDHPSRLDPAERHRRLFGDFPVPRPTPEQEARSSRNRASSARLHHGRQPFDQRLYDRLPEITAPTLVLWGTDDRMVLPSQAEHYRARIPDVRVRFIEGGPHVLAATVPGAFLQLVLPFFEDRESPRADGAAAPTGQGVV